jgi:hypothetical protein
VGQVSEYDDEPREDFGASRDEEVPEGVDPETGEITEQTPREAAEAEGSTEQIEKAERARATYNKRIDAIFGDAAPTLQCPTCDGLGRVWDAQPREPDLVHPDNLVTCEACNGYGSVITGSKAPGRETTVCIACSGNGYRTVTPQPENVTPLQPITNQTLAASPAPVMGWMGPDGVFQPLGTPNAVGG